jgi:hypothetical protein
VVEQVDSVGDVGAVVALRVGDRDATRGHPALEEPVEDADGVRDSALPSALQSPRWKRGSHSSKMPSPSSSFRSSSRSSMPFELQSGFQVAT